jgi:phage tail sheath protein FI
MKRSLDVSVEEVVVGIASGSTLRIDVTSVLLEIWCAHELQWAAYERNTPPIWAQVVRQLRGYLGSLWVSEALQGTKAQEAFVVTCDQSTMTPEDIRNGHLICLVGVALVTAAEFTFYRIHIHQKALAAAPL